MNEMNESIPGFLNQFHLWRGPERTGTAREVKDNDHSNNKSTSLQSVNPMNSLLQEMLLHGYFQRHGQYSTLTPEQKQHAKSLGYMDVNQAGRAYTRGVRTSPETCFAALATLRTGGHDVQSNGWTSAAKKYCRDICGMTWTTVNKFMQNDYRTRVGSGGPDLGNDFVLWLRHFAINHANYQRADYQAAIVIHHHYFLAIGTVGLYLQRAGLTMQVLRRIAAQRNTRENHRYSRRFQLHVQRFNRIAFYDESGISGRGMNNRRNQRYGIKGAGGAYLEEYLRRWPHLNLTVMAFLDKDGAFGVEGHEGGTTAQMVNDYFARHAQTLHQRGVDCIVIDNCSSHHIGPLLAAISAYPNIAICFLPKYWPQWNPIELAWNKMKDVLQHGNSNLITAPMPAIRAALQTITPALARGWIRHCNCYSAANYT